MNVASRPFSTAACALSVSFLRDMVFFLPPPPRAVGRPS